MNLHIDQARPRVGILGGGQLARMTAEAGRVLNVDVVILEREAMSPAGQIVGADNEIVGDWRDEATRQALAERVDLITLENEFVDPAALDWFLQRGVPVYPGPSTLGLVQDKFRQKTVVAAAGVPVPLFRAIDSELSLIEAGKDFGWPLVVKSRRLGYDGHGNVTVHSPSDASTAIASLARPSGQRPGMSGPADLFAEEFVPFTGELAVMVVRGCDGSLAVYPVVETIQRRHICHEVIVPARVPSEVLARAREIAVAAVKAVDAVGVVGVELFWLANGSVVYNEMAPRPHNSGHYSIEGCETSQFANHLHAVLGRPLGPTSLRAPGVAMVNLLGTRSGEARPIGVDEAVTTPDVFVHLYGKREVRPLRKMGHLTALGNTADEALATAQAAAEKIWWS